MFSLKNLTGYFRKGAEPRSSVDTPLAGSIPDIIAGIRTAKGLAERELSQKGIHPNLFSIHVDYTIAMMQDLYDKKRDTESNSGSIRRALSDYSESRTGQGNPSHLMAKMVAEEVGATLVGGISARDLASGFVVGVESIDTMFRTSKSRPVGLRREMT